MSTEYAMIIPVVRVKILILLKRPQMSSDACPARLAPGFELGRPALVAVHCHRRRIGGRGYLRPCLRHALPYRLEHRQLLGGEVGGRRGRGLDPAGGIAAARLKD